MRSRPVVALVATLVLVGLAFLALAATTGPSDLLRGDGPGAPAPPTNGVEPPETERPPLRCEDFAETAEERARCDPAADDPAWWRLATALLSILAIGLAVLVVLRVARLVWEHRPRSTTTPTHAVAVDETRDRLAREVVEAAGEQHAALLQGSPRNAIVACWHRFERIARRAGVPPEPWETANEFTARVLTDLGADPHALAWLAGLYREARFSDHELTESDRRSAQAALEEITSGIRT